MGHCYNCNMGYKLEQCCQSHPETGETIDLKLDDGRIVEACPHLDNDGSCSNYEDRPEPCRDYQCPKLSEMDLFELLGFDSDN